VTGRRIDAFRTPVGEFARSPDVDDEAPRMRMLGGYRRRPGRRGALYGPRLSGRSTIGYVS
jgi:hypothetical protein